MKLCRNAYRQIVLGTAGVTLAAQACLAQPLVNVEIVGDEVKMTSTKDGTVLCDPRGYGPHDGGLIEVLEPEIEYVIFPDGYDVHYTFTNDTNEVQKVGRLLQGVFTLGPDITYHDFKDLGEIKTANVDTWGGSTWRYPRLHYAPVHVIANDKYAIGFSIQYPILEYKNDLTMHMSSPGGQKAIGPGGKGWGVFYKLNNYGNEPYNGALLYEVLLQPGETREYIFSVRVTDKPDEWQRTLVPYRDFFNKTYGGVRYERDPRPSYGVQLADDEFVTQDNPDGWSGATALRPDIFGWLPRISWLFERENWPRTMVWRPGGVYQEIRDTPFDFVHRWLDDPELMEAIDPDLGLQQVEWQGRKLGLWWTYSLQVSEEPGKLVGFDVHNPDHVAAAFAELDLAVAAGATMIGLDSFTVKFTPMWDLYEWILKMQDRYPDVSFIVEPHTSDFIHTLAPCHFTGHNDRFGIPEKLEDIWLFTSPHYLADFLNPGHEIWGQYRYWAYQFFDVEVTTEMVQNDVAKIAALGFSPSITYSPEVDLDQYYEAAETWWDTVPNDILVFAPPLGSCAIDVDGNGVVNVLDFIAFQNLFTAEDPIADLNGDGIYNILDFVTFQAMFHQGCK